MRISSTPRDGEWISVKAKDGSDQRVLVVRVFRSKRETLAVLKVGTDFWKVRCEGYLLHAIEMVEPCWEPDESWHEDESESVPRDYARAGAAERLYIGLKMMRSSAYAERAFDEFRYVDA